MYTSYKSPPNPSIITPSATQHSGNTDFPSPGVTVQESCVCHVLTWTPSVALLAPSWRYFFPCFFFFFNNSPHVPFSLLTHLSCNWNFLPLRLRHLCLSSPNPLPSGNYLLVLCIYNSVSVRLCAFICLMFRVHI